MHGVQGAMLAGAVLAFAACADVVLRPPRHAGGRGAAAAAGRARPHGGGRDVDLPSGRDAAREPDAAARPGARLRERRAGRSWSRSGAPGRSCSCTAPPAWRWSRWSAGRCRSPARHPPRAARPAARADARGSGGRDAGTGIVHVLGAGDAGPLTTLGWHIGLALGLVPLVVLHLATRPQRPRRGDLSRGAVPAAGRAGGAGRRRRSSRSTRWPRRGRRPARCAATARCPPHG